MVNLTCLIFLPINPTGLLINYGEIVKSSS